MSDVALATEEQMEHPLAAQVRDLLTYDPLTGEFTWNKTRGGVARAGSKAGTIRANGYCRVNVNGAYHYAHRLAWLVTHDRFPEDQIDHIDGDPGNNRICNLREATGGENSRNQRVHSDSETGIKGVYFNKRRGKFASRIMRDGVVTWLGSYEKIDDAAAAYQRAAEQIHGAFAHHVSQSGGEHV